MILDCFEYNQHFVAMMNIINFARITNKAGKFEKHHIIPRSWFKLNKINVDNTKTNIVNLTHEQHTKVHKLSIYCIKSDIMKQKMLSAYNILEHKGTKLYMKTGTPNDETKSKIRSSVCSYYQNNPDARKKTSETTKNAMKNVPYEKLAYWKGKQVSEETKQKVKEKNILVRKELVKLYNEYKQNGGVMKWNDWMHERKLCKKK